jgi:uncharacterized protein
MKLLARCIVLLLPIVLAPAAHAADFAQGLDALDRGDYAKAVKIIKPLAEGGDARAQYRMGTFYALGNGVPQDYVQATVWLKKAAAQGNAHAENDLGVLYELGRGVAGDPKEAAKWYRMAAMQGLGAAQLGLASLYQEGQGVPRDLLEAFAWANAASQLGEARGQKLQDAVAKLLTPAQYQQAQKLADQYSQKYVQPFQGK